MPDETFTPDATNARAFRDALGYFATGVTLVTIAGPGGPMGFTANSFASVSMDPPLVLWSPARSSRRFGAFASARHFAIHVLASDQADCIARFARDGIGFDSLDYHLSPDNVPLVSGALARFECEQHATHDGGDHLIIVGRVLRAAMTEGIPLVFSGGTYGEFAPG